MTHDDEILDRPIPIDDECQRVRLHVRPGRHGRRLDVYLHARYPHLSRTAVQRLIRQGSVTVNGQPAKPSHTMAAHDEVELTLPAPEPIEVIPEEMPLEVLYEDADIIAINKRADIVCHPANRYQTGTLVNGLVHYANNLSHGSDPFRPGIVHRLDKNTTGVILIAKNDEAHWRLSLQFERRTVQKTYLAVVHGSPRLDSDVIDMPIGGHPIVREKFQVMVRDNKIDIGKPAVTGWEAIERFDGYTLVKLSPKTGRTHQLRVHMSHIGHPIVGDIMYGGRAASDKEIAGSGSEEVFLRYQALHAWKIEFQHPIREQRMEIEAPFHAKLRHLMQLLRAHRSR
ncbi:MAG: RluA family pseudouridine synthase [Phycisphaerales bacterium]|nr:RluA family pseudouridine synthase [Phycisphaerales bacterium]